MKTVKVRFDSGLGSARWQSSLNKLCSGALQMLCYQCVC